MCAKKMFSLVLAIVILLLATGGASTHAGPSGGQASLLGKEFTATSSGTPISRPFLIADLSVDTRVPEVAYNSQQQEYLVVWWNDRPGNDDIYGQRVSKTGALVGPYFAIAYGTGYEREWAHVACNSQQNEYLVTWYQHDSGNVYSVLGQRLSAIGQPQGGAISVAVGTSSLDYYHPSVAYDPTDDKYLVVYESYSKSTLEVHLIAQAFNNNGLTWGAAFEITGMATNYMGLSDLTYNPLRNEFLVVWDQDYPTDVLARRVKMTGGADVLGSVFTISTDTSNDDSDPHVAAVPRSPDGQYLVVWSHCYAISCNPGDIWAQFVSGEGNLEGSPINFPSTFSYVTSVDVAGCEYSSTYFMTWMQTNGGFGGDIAARFISVGGVTEPDFWLDGNVGTRPVVTYGPNGDYLVAYENQKKATSDFDIWGRLVGNRLYLPLVRK
jgi:hypothetical protein